MKLVVLSWHVFSNVDTNYIQCLWKVMNYCEVDFKIQLWVIIMRDNVCLDGLILNKVLIIQITHLNICLLLSFLYNHSYVLNYTYCDQFDIHETARLRNICFSILSICFVCSNFIHIHVLNH